MFSFSQVILGQYLPGKTFFHRLDPRSKILSFIIITIGLLGTDKLWVIFTYLASLYFLYYLTELPVKYVIRGLKPMIWLLLITSLLHLLFTPGKTIMNIFFLKITEEGVRQAYFMGGRLITIVGFSLLLTYTTSPLDLTDGIGRLLKPLSFLGLPVQDFTLMMSIAMRFIPILYEEADRITKAQISRGADFGSGNLIEGARNFMPLFIPLLLCIFRRADELALAMEIRGYRSEGKRTRMRELKMKISDYFTLILLILLTVVVYIV